MPAWLWWIVLAGVLAVAEVSSLTLVLGMLAGGAAAGAITAAAGGPVLAQVLVAVAASLALLVGVRPVARRHLIASGTARTGTDALVGMQAVVLHEVSGEDGLVRLNGAQWTARSYEPAQQLPAGTVVRVIEIRGATAVVLPDTAEDGGQTADGPG